MKNGRLVSYGALAAGTGMLAAAAKRKRDSATTRTFNYHRQPVTMQRQPDGSWKQSTALPAARSPYRTEKENTSDAARYSGAALGTGLAGAGVSHAGKRVMTSQSRKWLDRDVKLNQEVNRLVPSLKTKAGDFSGGTRESIARAGLKQGEATQARYFRGVYDKHAKLLGRTRKGSLITAGAGAAGLLATKKYADRNRKRR